MEDNESSALPVLVLLAFVVVGVRACNNETHRRAEFIETCTHAQERRGKPRDYEACRREWNKPGKWDIPDAGR